MRIYSYRTLEQGFTCALCIGGPLVLLVSFVAAWLGQIPLRGLYGVLPWLMTFPLLAFLVGVILTAGRMIHERIGVDDEEIRWFGADGRLRERIPRRDILAIEQTPRMLPYPQFQIRGGGKLILFDARTSRWNELSSLRTTG